MPSVDNECQRTAPSHKVTHDSDFGWSSTSWADITAINHVPCLVYEDIGSSTHDAQGRAGPFFGLALPGNTYSSPPQRPVPRPSVAFF